jgi:hypothetical protein
MRAVSDTTIFPDFSGSGDFSLVAKVSRIHHYDRPFREKQPKHSRKLGLFDAFFANGFRVRAMAEKREIGANC